MEPNRMKLTQMITNSLHFQTARLKRGLLVGVSARHIHLCRRDLETLFGKGYELTVTADLLEPGEFAAKETLTVCGPKMRALQGVRILGPLRGETQVELALSDAIPLGMRPPVRRSGDIAGSSPITLVGPAGALNLPYGAIRANRHIHLDPETAMILGVAEGDSVTVRVDGEKPTLLGGVQVRVLEGWIPVIHLDTDDANAADLRQGSIVYL